MNKCYVVLACFIFTQHNKSEKYNPKSWNKWVKKQEAKLVPGAKDFILRYKKIKNAKIIFLSNRDNTTLMATKNNMKDLGIFFSDDIFLLRLLNGLNRYV